MIKPISGWVLVEPKKLEEKTDGGIFIPEVVVGDIPQEGKVVAVGPDEYNEYGITRKSPVDVGDEVLFKKWGGNEIKIDKETYLFVKFDDFLAIK